MGFCSQDQKVPEYQKMTEHTISVVVCKKQQIVCNGFICPLLLVSHTNPKKTVPADEEEPDVYDPNGIPL